MERNAPAKPERGTAWRESHDRSEGRRAHERKAMEAAKLRDRQMRRGCAWPFCEHRRQGMRLDACHQTHRGMGGDPKGTRTARATVIGLCPVDHGRYDRHDIDFDPQTPEGFDGPLDFLERQESGRMEIVASETRIGVSVTRGTP